jgi:hypothetical protein
MLQKQLVASQNFIQKQNMELQKLHNQRAEMKSKEPKPDPKQFLNDFVSDPVKALEAEMERREQSKQENAQSEVAQYNSNLQMVTQAVPNLDSLIPLMMEELSADGIQNPSIEMIKESIKTEPHLVLSYARRADYRAKLTATEQTGKQIIEKVANGSKKAQPIGGKSIGPQKEVSIPKNLRNLSDEELAGIFKKMTGK